MTRAVVPSDKEPGATRRRLGWRSFGVWWVVMGTLTLQVSVSAVLIHWRVPVTVSFDMKGTLDRFSEQAGAQSLDEVQATALTERFMTTLNAALVDYQVRHHALILVTPAIVMGAPDITDEIQTRVAQTMSAGMRG